MKENVLKRANDVVAERGKVYGHPLKDFRRIALIWSGILGITVTPDRVAMCMMGVKMSRLVETPGHADSILDIAGYTWCLEQCFNGEKDENQLEIDLKENTGPESQRTPLAAGGFRDSRVTYCSFCGELDGAHSSNCIGRRIIPTI